MKEIVLLKYQEFFCEISPHLWRILDPHLRMVLFLASCDMILRFYPIRHIGNSQMFFFCEHILTMELREVFRN